MTDRVLIEIDTHVAHVRLNRADKLNALDSEMFEALNDVPQRLAAVDDLRAVVVSGEGRSFCAGIDFQSFLASPELLARAFDPVPDCPTNFVQHAALCWQWVDAPVIAAITGHCFGGGLQIALGADIRIASPDARLSVMEIKWGLVPDMGGTQRLKNLVRLDVAMELALSGRIVEAREACTLGLVTCVLDDPLTGALDLAAAIARRSPDAVVATKKLFGQAWNAELAEGLGLEAGAQRSIIGRPNQIEAVRANLKQREAIFHKAKKHEKS